MPNQIHRGPPDSVLAGSFGLGQSRPLAKVTSAQSFKIQYEGFNRSSVASTDVVPCLDCRTTSGSMHKLPDEETLPNILVCTGSLVDSLSRSKLNNFVAIDELGYDCCKVPLLLTTCSAVYGRLIPSHRELDHHLLIWSTSCSRYTSSERPRIMGLRRLAVVQRERLDVLDLDAVLKTGIRPIDLMVAIGSTIVASIVAC